MKKLYLFIFCVFGFLLFSCGGKIGISITFDSDLDEVITDPSPEIDNFLISSTRVNPSDGFTYVDVDVDWANNLAYTASRQSGICFEAIDFSNESSPIVAKSFGTATTPSTTCGTALGIKLLQDNTQLLISSESPSYILEVWNLRADPTVLDFEQILTAGTSVRPKRIAGVIEQDEYSIVYLSHVNGAGMYQYAYTDFIESYTPWNAGVSDHNCSAIMGNGEYLITGRWVNAASISVVDVSTNTLISSLPMNNGSSSGFWSMVSNSDGTKAFAGGWVSAFLKFDPLGDPKISITQRFEVKNAEETFKVFRAAEFVEDGGHTFVYAVRNSFDGSDIVLDVFLVDDIENPLLVGQTVITEPNNNYYGEPYGLKINTSTRRVLIVTNKGYVVIGDIDEMSQASSQYPTF